MMCLRFASVIQVSAIAACCGLACPTATAADFRTLVQEYGDAKISRKLEVLSEIGRLASDRELSNNWTEEELVLIEREVLPIIRANLRDASERIRVSSGLLLHSLLGNVNELDVETEQVLERELCDVVYLDRNVYPESSIVAAANLRALLPLSSGDTGRLFRTALKADCEIPLSRRLFHLIAASVSYHPDLVQDIEAAFPQTVGRRKAEMIRAMRYALGPKNESALHEAFEPLLLGSLDDESSEVRMAALDVLNVLIRFDQASNATYQRIGDLALDHSEDASLRGQALWVLGVAGWSGRADGVLDLLEHVALDEENPPSLRSSAISLSARLQDYSDAALAFVLRFGGYPDFTIAQSVRLVLQNFEEAQREADGVEDVGLTDD